MKLFCSATCRKVRLIVVVICSSITEVFAQDPQFSQFYANPIYTNPAFAGGSTVGRGVMNYRSQWPGISGTFRTFTASYDEHYDIINGGIGIIVSGDEAGVGTLRTFSVSAIYSYQLIINKYVTIRAAIEGGYYQKAIDFSKLIFYDQIAKGRGIQASSKELPPANPIYYPVVSTGFVVYTNYFYGGLALHNLNQPNASFFPDAPLDPGSTTASMHLKTRYTAHAGAIIPLIRSRDENKSSNLWPNIMYMQQGIASQTVATQINLGMYYNKGPLVLGTYFRQNAQYNSDAIIFLVGFRLPKLRFGVSYDATVSDARPGARQSYEVSLAFELRKRAHKKTFRNIRCPEF